MTKQTKQLIVPRMAKPNDKANYKTNDKTQYITPAEYKALCGKHSISGPSTRKEQPETAIRRAIADYLKLHGWKVARIVQSALSERGIPDLVAIRGGETVWIEVKTAKGRLSQYQEAWLQDLEDHGGWWIVARSMEDVEHLGPHRSDGLTGGGSRV